MTNPKRVLITALVCELLWPIMLAVTGRQGLLNLLLSDVSFLISGMSIVFVCTIVAAGFVESAAWSGFAGAVIPLVGIRPLLARILTGIFAGTLFGVGSLIIIGVASSQLFLNLAIPVALSGWIASQIVYLLIPEHGGRR